MCWMCDADASDPDKTWRLINPELGAWEEYDRQHHVDHPPNHPIFGIAGATTMNVTLECLHVIFNNGIMAHFLASVLHILCWTEGPGRQAVPPPTRLGFIWETMQVYYKECEVSERFTNLNDVCRHEGPTCKFSIFESESWRDEACAGSDSICYAIGKRRIGDASQRIACLRCDLWVLCSARCQGSLCSDGIGSWKIS